MSTQITEKGISLPPRVDNDMTKDIELHHLDGKLDTKGDGPDWDQLIADAKASEEAEKNMPLMQAFRVYPKAVAWTFAVTLCFVM
jgi:hypothetical protein